MKINHNMSAVTVNNQLKRTEDALTTALERLSSGFRINHAADDAAGMAISNKMQAQIDGLNQASRNASDGSSVLETADGALNEVTSMIQRMRELSVQAANGTNTKDDREAIQDEIDNLLEEIDRVSKDTEFNTQPLLDGTLERRTYANTKVVNNIQVSDEVPSDTYVLNIIAEARSAVYTGEKTDSAGTNTVPKGTVSLNGVGVEFTGTETEDEVYEMLRTAGEEAGINVFATANPPVNTATTDPEYAGYEPKTFAYGDSLCFVSDKTGSATSMMITCDNDELAEFLGIDTSVTAIGTDAQVEFPADKSPFSAQATIQAKGNQISVTDRTGFSIYFEVQRGYTNSQFQDMQKNTGGVVASKVMPGNGKELCLEVTDIGKMTLQIGANSGQSMEISIPDMSTEKLGISSLNVVKTGGADEAITLLDDALAKVSDCRSKLGAYENRLDYAVNSLDEFSENMTSALSRIEDIDMAEEMSEYTKQNVLAQAATSVLAQANDRPQQVLQLLQ
jgi:flagellin